MTPTRRDEIDFRELRKNPERLLGYTYVYFLAALVLLGLLYGWHLTETGKNLVPALVLRDSSAFLEDIPFRAPQIIPPVNVMEVSRPDVALLARGRELYTGNCSSCHGADGGGDGPTASTLNPKPRDFRSLKGWTNGSSLSALYKTLEDGMVKSGMPSFSYLAPSDRFAVIHAVRSFASGHPVDTPQQLQELEAAYELSKGRTSPAQIPVKKAMQMIVREAAPRSRLLRSIADETEWQARVPDGSLLDRVTADRGRLVTAMVLPSSELPSLHDFIAQVSADPGMVGFRPSVLQLATVEWEQLRNTLRRLKNDAGGQP